MKTPDTVKTEELVKIQSESSPIPWELTDGDQGNWKFFPSIVFGEEGEIVINESHDRMRESIQANAYLFFYSPMLLKEVLASRRLLTELAERLRVMTEVGAVRTETGSWIRSDIQNHLKTFQGETE